MSTEREDDNGLGGFDTIIEDRVGEDADIREPKMYKVIMLNDDYTPFDFVSAILQTVFKHFCKPFRFLLDAILNMLTRKDSGDETKPKGQKNNGNLSFILDIHVGLLLQ